LPFFDPSDDFHVYSPYGLDESVIKIYKLAYTIVDSVKKEKLPLEYSM
jgi:hypothetical protein